MYDKIRTTLFPLLAAFIWGTAFVFQTYNTAGTFTFNFMRSFVASVFLVALLPIFTKGDFRHLLIEKSRSETLNLWLGGVISGVALAFGSFLQQYGVDHGVEAGKASFLTALYVVLVPVFGVFLKKKVTPNTWIAIVIAVVGQYFLCIKRGFTVNPLDLIVLAGALLFAVQILAIDHFSPKCDGVKMSCIQLLTMAVISLVLSCIFENPQPADLTDNILPVLYLGICSSGIAYTLQIVAQKDSNPTLVSLLLSMEAVFGVISAAIFLKEFLSVREYIGCLLMVGAVLLSQVNIFEFICKNKAGKDGKNEEQNQEQNDEKIASVSRENVSEVQTEV